MCACHEQRDIILCDPIILFASVRAVVRGELKLEKGNVSEIEFHMDLLYGPCAMVLGPPGGAHCSRPMSHCGGSAMTL